MGKGSRMRKIHSDEKAKQALILSEKAVEQKRKRKWAVIAGMLAVLLIALLCAGMLGYRHCTEIGFFQRNTVALQSQHVTVNCAQMNYFIHNAYQSILDYFGEYTSSLQLDQSKKLKEQAFSDSQTWFEYLAQSATESVKREILLAESAYATGISLTEEEKAALEVRADAMMASDVDYGIGVQRQDILGALELSALALKYQRFLLDSMSFDLAACEKAYSENANTYRSGSYLLYTIDVSKLGTDEAERRAEILLACQDEASFGERMREMMKKDDEKVSEATLANAVSNAKVKESSYTEGDTLSEWLYAEERVPLESYRYTGTDGKINICLLLTVPARTTGKTVNVRQILVETKEEAERILAEWEQGKKTSSSFGTLALAYSQDGGSAYIGGLYEYIYEGEMVSSFNQWCFDKSRKNGDTGIVQSSVGFHVVYFEGETGERWMTEVIEDLRDQTYQSLLVNYDRLYPVTVNNTGISRIDA